MTFGFGIFLSALFLGIIYLYSKTRDSWNWKKIWLYTLGVPFGLIVIISGGVYLYSEYKDRPVKLTEYAGFELGASKSDVLFYKGEPNDKDFLIDDEDYKSLFPDLPDNFNEFKGNLFEARETKNGVGLIAPKGASDEEIEKLSNVPSATEVWTYDRKDNFSEGYIVYFNQDDKVELLVLEGYFSGVNKISSSSSTQRAIEELGEPDAIKINDKNGSRDYFYRRYNMSINFKQNNVEYIRIRVGG